MSDYRGILGILAIVFVAWTLSTNRKKVNWRTVGIGVLLQIILALFFFKIPDITEFFTKLNVVVEIISGATTEGTRFVFGYIGGGKTPFEVSDPNSMFILAFQSLPIILIISAITSLLYYWKILPLMVKGFSFVLRKTMGISGCEGLSASANIFVGMIEAPLCIRPYVSKMSQSELFVVMSTGMATIAGTMMVIYARILKDIFHDKGLGQILMASVISAPAAIAIAKIMVPETQDETLTVDDVEIENEAHGSMDAVARGTTNGLTILINVVAMLIVMVALVFIANYILCLCPEVAGEKLSFQRILGWVMAPVVWLIGIPWAEAKQAGALMGTKTILNEFLAYSDLAKNPLPRALCAQTSSSLIMVAMSSLVNSSTLATSCEVRKPSKK